MEFYFQNIAREIGQHVSGLYKVKMCHKNIIILLFLRLKIS